ncbi:caspase family protein [Myxococcota bacterium]|nr:caspase family protein [Myxococcota bacterium]
MIALRSVARLGALVVALAPASVLAAPAAAVVADAAVASTESRAYAIIVANNTSADGTLEKLRYADDDGARYHELFSLVTTRTEILTVLDAETQRVHPEVARAARAPTRRELDAAISSIFGQIEKDNAAGIRTTFYFVFVGHGSIGDNGEGTVHLVDGRFSRSDLFQKVIAPSPARVNHVIIDACHAFLMVARRGGEKSRAAAIEDAVAGFVGRESLDRYPNTGVLLSTSQAAEVHEWSRFAAGIFSHEVRSALAGGADVDGDGRVTYDEAKAFISAANAKVSDPRAKLTAFAQAPAMHRAEPLFVRSVAAKRGPTVQVPAKLAGRRWLEDARGVRYGDFNVAPDGPLTFVLVPSSIYYLRSDTDEIKLPVEVTPVIDAGTLPLEKVQLAARGAEALAFQRDLFAIPFGRAYYEGYQASAPAEASAAFVHTPDEGLPTKTLVAGGFAAGSLGALATGIFFGLKAKDQAADYRAAIGTDADVDALRRDSERSALTANLLYVGAGVLLTTAATVWLLPDAE